MFRTSFKNSDASPSAGLREADLTKSPIVLCEALVLASVFIDQTLFVYLDPFGLEDYDSHTIRSLLERADGCSADAGRPSRSQSGIIWHTAPKTCPSRRPTLSPRMMAEFAVLTKSPFWRINFVFHGQLSPVSAKVEAIDFRRRAAA